MEVQYYPSPDDRIWNNEIEALIPYLDGKGMDVGCGGRSLNKDVTRVDIDKRWEPEILASGDKIPVPDASYDFITCVHNLEHYEDQDAVLREFFRIVRPGGVVGIVHPDVEFTKPQKEEAYNENLREQPYNKHYHERTMDEFVRWINTKRSIGFKMLDWGPAQAGWSFYVILVKTG